MATTVKRTRPWGEAALDQLLGSPSRARLLACLLLPGARPSHIRELERRCGLPYGPVYRELKRLEKLGVVRGERIGNSTVYSAASDSPLLPGLRELVRRAVGIIPLLMQALDQDNIAAAFVYGSVAAGEDHPGSDVDLMVIGDTDDEAVSEALADVTAQTGLEITPVVYPPQEFRQRLREHNSFVSSVLRKPKIFVRGDEDVLRRLGE
ncbi:MAG: nucleotidyltransferase domain-containing protein [Armatimonadia bacterium]